MIPIELPCNCHLISPWLEGDTSDTLMDWLLEHVSWEHSSVTIRSHTHPMPRLTWYAGNYPYSYSGHTHPAHPLPQPVDDIRQQIESEAASFGVNVRFNAVLMNYYRDGTDCLGWHSDSEPVLGKNPVVASLSLGHERVFKMKNKADKSRVLDIPLGHGDLLLMAGSTQHDWLHAINRTKRPLGPRINLTFRKLLD